MEEQNRVNEEKDIKSPRQETKKVTGREKVGEGAYMINSTSHNREEIKYKN